MFGKSKMETYITICKIDSQQEFAVWLRKLKQVALFLKDPLYCFQRRQWQPTLVFLPGKSDGQRSLVGCRPWGLEELDTTE